MAPAAGRVCRCMRRGGGIAIGAPLHNGGLAPAIMVLRASLNLGHVCSAGPNWELASPPPSTAVECLAARWQFTAHQEQVAKYKAE